MTIIMISLAVCRVAAVWAVLFVTAAEKASFNKENAFLRG